MGQWFKGTEGKWDKVTKGTMCLVYSVTCKGQGHKDKGIMGHRDKETQGQRDKGTMVQWFKGTIVQSDNFFKGTKAQRDNGTKGQCL